MPDVADRDVYAPLSTNRAISSARFSHPTSNASTCPASEVVMIFAPGKNRETAGTSINRSRSETNASVGGRGSDEPLEDETPSSLRVISNIARNTANET